MHVPRHRGPFGRIPRFPTVLVAVALALLAAGQALAFDPADVSARHRDLLTDADEATFIIVRLRDDAGLMVSAAGVVPDPDAPGAGDPAVLQETLAWRGQALEMRRLFAQPAEVLAAQKRDLEAAGAKHVPNLNAYGILRTPGGVPLRGADLRDLLAKLNENPDVAIAYPRPHYASAALDGATPADDLAVDTDTPNFEGQQSYRGYPYQFGFGATPVVSWAGSQGENVKIIDIEGGWHWDHEDLPTPFVDIGTHGADGYKKHGTSVMGVVAGQDNGFGVRGFVPAAQVGGVVSEVAWDDPDNWTDCSVQIMTAANELASGDVILIELQAAETPYQTPWLPMEFWPANFEAMQLVRAFGMVVVEAAGNSGQNLDDWLVDFVRDDPVHDCGAIMVGGIDPETGEAAQGSNHGERVDVHAWFGGVVTAGGGNLFGGDEGLPVTRFYRDNFGGTSSASAIVTGVVGSIQSIWEEEQGSPLLPSALRTLLRDSGHHTAGVSDIVGTRPDIPEFFRHLFDTGAPYAVDDLWAADIKSNAVKLAWHAPADDYRGLIVAAYDLRYSESPITEADFDLATPVPGVVEPWAPGMLQADDVTGLAPATTYYFAMRSRDPGDRWSPISNVVAVTTDPPAPEIALSGEQLAFGPARVGHAATASFTVENLGSADLLLQSCTPYSGPDVVLACVDLPAAPIPPGGSAQVEVSATPLALGNHLGVFVLASNDPDQPVVNQIADVDGADLAIGDTTILAVPGVPAAGALEAVNPSAVPVGYGGLAPRVAYDTSHGQSTSDYQNIYFELFGEFAFSELDALTAETLAVTDMLHVPGSPQSWTPAEIQAVADWVQAGGGLYVGINFNADQDAHLNPLFEALGLGSPLAYGFDADNAGVTTELADDPLLADTSQITLSNVLYRLSAVPAGADWLVRNAGGTVEKAFKAEVGAGRVVVVADHLYNTPALAAEHAAFARAACTWLAGWPGWISFPEVSGSVPAGTTAQIPVAADATGLAVGTYTFSTAATVLGTPETFTVTLEVVDPVISGIGKVYGDPYETTVSWDTNVAVTCRFWYRDYGTTAWSGPIGTPAGLAHEVAVPTQANRKYDGLIEVVAGGTVLLSEQITLKTPRWYPIEMKSDDAPPAATALVGAAPNPFNPSTVVRFDLARGQRVRMDVYDLRGRLVRSLLDEPRRAGRHEVRWDGRDDRGRGVSSGIYFVRMQGETYRSVGKLTLLK